MSVAIATWTVGKLALDVLAQSVQQHKVDSIDLVVNAIRVVEEDPTTGCYIIGRGGYPNSAGVCEFDAALMRGADCTFAGVGALRSIPTPIEVAKSIMDSSPHSVLVGEGAREFAAACGHVCHPEESIQADMTTSTVPVQAEDFSKCANSKDTLCVIMRDSFGNIAAGGSSSGKPYKHPGRLGDVPLPGCGLYADNELGAACCTGDGDAIARFCPAFQVVQLMGQGLSPAASSREVVMRIQRRLARCGAAMFEIGIIAMSKEGVVGAATSVDHWTDPRTGEVFNGFPYAVWYEGALPNVELVPACTQVEENVTSLDCATDISQEVVIIEDSA